MGDGCRTDTVSAGMFCFNMFVPCFPLDCSSIIMNTMAAWGSSWISTAKCMVFVSAPLIFVFVGFGIWQTYETGGSGADDTG